MTNEELLQQLLDAMNTQSEALQNQITREITAAETRINVKLENEVSKRIEALFDGYKLTHEKQWELERRIEAIERKLGIAI